jgi:transposase
MTREEALAILKKEQEEAIKAILVLAAKAEKYDQLFGPPEPTAPSGMTPSYQKENHRGRKKKPGRKKGHAGVGRPGPKQISTRKEHCLSNCPHCGIGLNKPIRSYQRIIEDISVAEPEVTEHTVNGYWCPRCQKIVKPAVTDALPNSRLGLRLVVLTAWLHYAVGVSVNNLVRTLSVFYGFHISAGGLTQAWINLASLLKPEYEALGQKVSRSAVLHADETGWRLNGITHWLWCFTTKRLCYYLITPSRGSPVIKQVLGTLFQGILITDFWGAYNNVVALAKQKCLYHLFTELVKVDQRNNSLAWHIFRKRLSRLLKDALRLAGKRDSLTSEVYAQTKIKLYARLNELTALNEVDDADVQRLRKRLARHRHELFTFLEYSDVSPYNNHAEQQVRPPVISRKISQQNRSKRGAESQAILMSLFQSAKLQEMNPIESVLEMAQYRIAPQPNNAESLKKAA